MSFSPETDQTASAQDRQWAEHIRSLRAGHSVPFEEQWYEFQRIYADREQTAPPPLIWQPDDDQVKRSNIGGFMRKLNFETYEELFKWSVQNREEFWRQVIDRLGIRFFQEPSKILDLSNGVKNPRWLPSARLNIADSCFKTDPQKVAIISASETVPDLKKTTYAELEELVNLVANGLEENGFKAGDRVALYMPMTVECVAAYLGIVRAGCAVVSIADSFPPEEIRKRMNIAGATTIITVDSFLRAGKEIRLYEKVIEADVPRAVVISKRETDLSLRNSDLTWNAFLSTRSQLDSCVCNPEDVTNILFSSGTTGTPKAIPWTQLTPMKCGMDGHFHQDIRSDDVVAWPTNIGWMMGPWLIYATFMNGATMALFEGAPVGQEFIDFIRESGVTIFGVVPSLVRAWRDSALTKENDWQKIRVFSSTGEPSNREDYFWLMSRSKYNAPVIEYLGGTEIGGGYITGSVVQPASPATFTTPALGLDFVILDEDNQPVEENEMGECFLIPPSIGLSQKLLNRDHEEVYYSGCPKGPNGEILRRHGDQFTRLTGGFYKAQGRADDTMNLGGIKVSSVELEKVVSGHPAVFECAAISVQPEGEGQEKLVIFMVLKESSDMEKLKKELAVLIRKKLNPLFKIYNLVELKTLPRTASNKLMRRKLREFYLSKIKK